jgi:hypothetical protein
MWKYTKAPTTIKCDVCQEQIDREKIRDITRPDWVSWLVCYPCAKEAQYTDDGVYRLRWKRREAGLPI